MCGFWYAYGIVTNNIKHTEMKSIDQNLFSTENYGGEFSVLNSFNPEKSQRSSNVRSKVYTVFLYVLSIVSVTFWVISLNILPFGHIFQFLLGSAVLFTNLLVFKWAKL